METGQLQTQQTAAVALRQNLERKTIPSLDGLRGISALSVALAHAWGLSRWIPADYAVVLFFEISGLLITWLLLTEQDRTGSIDRLSFMKRRTLRLFPAFYACWILSWLVPGVPGRWWSFFYMMDFITRSTPLPWTAVNIMGMAWSLGIEEKYYLIWPSVMKRFERKTLLKALLVLFAVVQIYHAVIYLTGSYHVGRVGLRYPRGFHHSGLRDGDCDQVGLASAACVAASVVFVDVLRRGHAVVWNGVVSSLKLRRFDRRVPVGDHSDGGDCAAAEDPE